MNDRVRLTMIGGPRHGQSLTAGTSLRTLLVAVQEPDFTTRTVKCRVEYLGNGEAVAYWPPVDATTSLIGGACEWCNGTGVMAVATSWAGTETPIACGLCANEDGAR